jgi:BRCT domain type II-containing protein
MPLDIIENLYILKNLHLGPQNGPRKLKTAKNSKLPKLPENCFELVGQGG